MHAQENLNQATDFAAATPHDPNDYALWVKKYDTLTAHDLQRMHAHMHTFAQRPLISIIMPVYNPPIAILQSTIDSVLAQLYPHWELCIADDCSPNPEVRTLLTHYAAQDPRIKLCFREENGHISRSSNSALALAEGEYIALFDHDDLLTVHALFWVVDAINQHPNADIIYSDEDRITESGERYLPYFKSDFNYELFLAQNMISHFGVYRHSRVKEIGGFRIGFEGSQDYDFALRIIERIPFSNIIHIPRILYHWRAIQGSVAYSADQKNYPYEAARRAIDEHFKRQNIKAEVMPSPDLYTFNRVRYFLQSQPLVSILIPTRDRADLLNQCIQSIMQKSSYFNYEIIVLDNGSVEPATHALFEKLKKLGVFVLREDSDFNFSLLNNRAAKIAQGEYLCLLNNDALILTADWLEEMLSFALQPQVGCVGARIWYPNQRLQHAGVVMGVTQIAGHVHKDLIKGEHGYLAKAVLHQNFSAVTGACLMVKKSIYFEVGGLDETLPVAFNDIDFCLKVHKMGYRNVWTPYAEIEHKESASRGYEDTPEKIQRFARDCKILRERWSEMIAYDPAYNPNLTIETQDFALAWPPRIARCV